MAMYQIECAYTCHTGNIRANNEDNFWCFGESLPVNNEGTKGICSKIISGNRAPAMAVLEEKAAARLQPFLHQKNLENFIMRIKEC